MTRWNACTLTLTLALLAQGCFAITDLDSYEVEEGAACDDDTQIRDLNVRLIDMVPHIGQWFEVRVVSEEDDFLRAKAVINPMISPDESFSMPGAVPEGRHSIDLFADLDQSGGYSPPPIDHAWRTSVCEIADYEHNTAFDNLPDPVPNSGDFVMRFADMDPFVNERFELHVTEDNLTDRTVGLYLIPTIPAAEFEVDLTGIIDNGTCYRIEFYADANGSGDYDPPPEDQAWQVNACANATGIDLDFPGDEALPEGNIDIEF